MGGGPGSLPAALPESKIISKEEMKELESDLVNREVKQETKFDDFSLKPVDAADVRAKEDAIIQSLQSQQAKVEKINGEIKLHFGQAKGLTGVSGKPFPFFTLEMVHFMPGETPNKKVKPYVSPVLK